MATAIKCGNCHGTHASATEVRECYRAPLPKRTAVPDNVQKSDMTPKQREYIYRLLMTREYRLPKPVEEYSKDQASVLIEDLVRAPKKIQNEQDQRRVVQDGMYITPDGTIFKVQKAVHGSGQLYAKELIPPEKFGGKATFVYRAGAIMHLKPEMLMTLEQAKQFGALYGTCVRCGRTLTREDSIERMMGPVCYGKGGWA